MNFCKTFFHEHFQSAQPFGSRSGPVFCRPDLGSKLFAKVISGQKKSPLARKELKAHQTEATVVVLIFFSFNCRS